MRYAVTLLILLTACTKDGPSEPAQPANGGVQPVIGSYCTGNQTSSATADGNDWRVTIYWNETTYRLVAGTDGIVRQQEVRSCRSGSCFIIGGVSAMTAGGAISYCADQLR